MASKRLRCVECGIDASPTWDWLWYGKEVESPADVPGGPGRKLLWLCPECAGDIGTPEERDRFFALLVAGELEP
jgi:hypothetical protein